MPNDEPRERIGPLYRLSIDPSTTEPERAAAKQQLEKLLAELGLTMADAARIASEQTSAAEEPDEPECTPREMVELVIDLLRQYLWHPDERVYLIMALWILHTHVYRQFRHTPRLIIFAAIKASGKTTAMTMVRFLSAGGDRLGGHTTSAALYRELHKGINVTGLYTKCCDEMDNAEYNKLFHAIFNDGFEEGGFVERIIGRDTMRFDTFAPICFASISKARFTPTNLDRSFLVMLHKGWERTKHLKKLTRGLYPVEDNILDVIDLIKTWAESVGGNSSGGKLHRWPEIPAALLDRDEDRWRPLLSIADAVGWGAEARAAAASPTFAVANSDPKIDLMRDIRKVFDELKTHHDRIWSHDLTEALHAIHESPWGGEWCGLSSKEPPHKLRQGELGRILTREWEIRSRSVRIGDRTAKGYYREQFESAWSDCGLPPSTALTTIRASQRKRKGSPQKAAQRHNTASQ
jgi:hypothetical protein